MLAFLIDNYDWFAVVLSLVFFYISGWFGSNYRAIRQSIPDEVPGLLVWSLTLCAAIAAYMCGFKLLEGGSTNVLISVVCFYVGWTAHKAFGSS